MTPDQPIHGRGQNPELDDRTPLTAEATAVLRDLGVPWRPVPRPRGGGHLLLAVDTAALDQLDRALRPLGFDRAPAGARFLGYDEVAGDWVVLDVVGRDHRPGADDAVPATGGRALRLRRLLRSLRYPGGLSVAIIGPDGAGKTTLADGLREALPIPTAYVYMGVWREYPWDRWLRLVPGARLAQRLLRLTLRSAQAWSYRVRGRLVLLDRFTSDVLLPVEELDRRGRITAALVRRIGTQPQLLVVLDAPAEVMYARKGEQTLDELDRRRRSYLDIAADRPDIVVIDATQPVAAVRREAQRAVWARLRRHWAA